MNNAKQPYGGLPPAKTQTATVELLINGKKQKVQITAPTGLTQPSSLLPQFQRLADSFVADAVKSVEESGARISCRKGCGACCRQVVPISDMEAQRLRQIVRQMPQERRDRVMAKFQAARETLDQAGLLKKFLNPEDVRDEEVTAIGLKYFAQNIACPFLEEESCSIHPERPIACREYLVTSPAENCSNPRRGKIHCVPMPVKLSKAIRRLGDPDGTPWLPLILALDQTGIRDNQPPTHTGTALVEMLFKKLAGTDKPASKASDIMLGHAAKSRPWWRFW
jgi:Fe-S-cluster containining protein